MTPQPTHNPPGGGRWTWDAEGAAWVPLEEPAAATPSTEPTLPEAAAQE